MSMKILLLHHVYLQSPPVYKNGLLIIGQINSIKVYLDKIWLM